MCEFSHEFCKAIKCWYYSKDRYAKMQITDGDFVRCYGYESIHMKESYVSCYYIDKYKNIPNTDDFKIICFYLKYVKKYLKSVTKNAT